MVHVLASVHCGSIFPMISSPLVSVDLACVLDACASVRGGFIAVVEVGSMIVMISMLQVSGGHNSNFLDLVLYSPCSWR